MILYDLEIVKGIAKPEDREEGIEYCKGWRDFAHMGIACICAYDTSTGRYRVFLEDNFGHFEDLVHAREVATFNGINFDDQVCRAHGIRVKTTYDLLREVWKAAGLDPNTYTEEHGPFSLDMLALANGLEGKTGHGALAPVLWQRGRYGTVIDYCLQDVRLLGELVNIALSGATSNGGFGALRDPRDPNGRPLSIALPLLPQLPRLATPALSLASTCRL